METVQRSTRCACPARQRKWRRCRGASCVPFRGQDSPRGGLADAREVEPRAAVRASLRCAWLTGSAHTGLDVAVFAGRLAGGQSQGAFPSCRCSATACSVTVARSRSIFCRASAVDARASWRSGAQCWLGISAGRPHELGALQPVQSRRTDWPPVVVAARRRRFSSGGLTPRLRHPGASGVQSLRADPASPVASPHRNGSSGGGCLDRTDTVGGWD